MHLPFELTLLLLPLSVGLLPTCQALFPNPRHLSSGTLPLILSPDFYISCSLVLPNRTSIEVPADLRAAIERAYGYIENDRHERLVLGRSRADLGLLVDADELLGLELDLTSSATGLSISDETRKAHADQDESYEMQVPADVGAPLYRGHVGRITANTTLGLFRGLSTFVQLVFYAPKREQRYILDTPVLIKDYPAFFYRGFMLDTARNFYGVNDIKRTLETMTWAKLNVFHWHATDSQSWPFFIPTASGLTEQGAYSPAKVYSKDDIASIRDFALARGISIILEIDIPGHSASVAASYPQHIACKDAPPWPTYSVEPPTGQLKLLDEDTQAFVEDVVRSAARQVDGEWFSTGGDEVNSACYSFDTATNASLTASNKTLYQAVSELVGGVHSVLRQEGKTPVVWEEMVLDYNVRLKNDTVIMVWISSRHVKAVADQGFPIVHAASDFFYLDCGAGGWVGSSLRSSWCPFVSWQKMYSFDPYAGLEESQYSQVLGGQSLLWSEQADPTNLDPFAWPRAAVAGEVFWTGANGPDGKPRDVVTALARLHDWRYRAVQRGVKAIPLQPEYCALVPNACDV